MRHLHYSADDERSLCGHRTRVPVRTGSRVYYVEGVTSVHVTKARKTDCAACRKLFRGAGGQGISRLAALLDRIRAKDRARKAKKSQTVV